MELVEKVFKMIDEELEKLEKANNDEKIDSTLNLQIEKLEECKNAQKIKLTKKQSDNL